jgi:uncharacterized protein YjbI with pentapeptide repeats
MNPVPLEVVALFAHEVPGALGLLVRQPPRVEATILTQVPPFVGAQSELALLLTADERVAAAQARAALRLRVVDDAPLSMRLSACVDGILKCSDFGAVAIVLPAARKVVGPSALSALAPALSAEQGRVKLFVQFHIVQDDDHTWSHTHGMAYYGLPDLECRTEPADQALATRLLEAGMAFLLEQGPDALRVGSLVEATEPDGRFLARFEVHPSSAVAGHDYDAWGALALVPVAMDAAQQARVVEHTMDLRSELRMIIAGKQRARDLDLRSTQLSGVDLSGLSGDRLDLSGANLRGASLREARLGGCRLQGAQLQGADWAGAVVRMCALDGAHGAGASFDGARIEDSSATGADLEGASFRKAKLTESSFERAVLREAVFENAQGEGVVFRGADLSSGKLLGAKLDDADFRGADLRGADLSGGRFRAADFRGALLEGARLDGADFDRARFDAGEGPREASAPTGAKADTAKLDRAAVTALRDCLAALTNVVGAGGAAGSGALPADLERLLEPLLEMPRTVPAATLLDHLQRILDGLDDGSSEPPEQLTPLLEPLMKAIEEGQPLDLKALFEALASQAGVAGQNANRAPKA